MATSRICLNQNHDLCTGGNLLAKCDCLCHHYSDERLGKIDNFPIGSQISTDVHGIGGRAETVSGTVVGYKYKLLVVHTDSGHGTLMVEPSKAVSL